MEASSGKTFNIENKICKRMRVGSASSYHLNSTVDYNRSNKLITLQKKKSLTKEENKLRKHAKQAPMFSWK